MKRDIKRDREKLEDVRRYNYNASTWDQTMEQGRRVKELIEEALPCYIDLCEHQQRMLDEAIEEHIQWEQCPNGVDFGDQENCPHADSDGLLPTLEVCRQCWSDYLDQKAKEREGK